MRRAELPRLAEALRPPLQTFVRESRVRIALLANSAGQVLAQHGFTRSYEVMNVASLAAAAHASSRALGEVTEAGPWAHLYHDGRERALFLAPLRTPGEELILVAIFEADSSLGIVRLFSESLEAEIARLPDFRSLPRSTVASDFESDLAAGLDLIPPERGSDD